MTSFPPPRKPSPFNPPPSPSPHPVPFPKPRPFHMTEPFLDRGLWSFWLTAEEPVLQYVANLHCILNPGTSNPFYRRPSGRILLNINPRYDYQEVWLWIHDLLQVEAQNIELNEAWESAIQQTIGVSGDEDE